MRLGGFVVVVILDIGVVLGFLGFLVVFLVVVGVGGVTDGPTGIGLVMVGWIALIVLVVSMTTVVGGTGPIVGVWAIGSLVRIVGFTGKGTGPLTGKEEVSVVGAMEGDVGVGIIRVGGSE